MRNSNTKLGLCLGLGLGLGALALSSVGCATKPEAADKSPSATSEAVERSPERSDTSEKVAESPSTRLERAVRTLDRGGEAATAKSDLESVLTDSRSSLEEQDEARLELSVARQALGDDEGAISIVEELLTSHPDGGRFAAREAAEKRLRLLVTGKETEDRSFNTVEKFAPVAAALAGYFQADEHGETLVDVLAFGRNGEKLEELGGLAIPAAKRDAMRQACTFCDNNLKVYQSISRSGSWVDLLRTTGEIKPGMPQADRSLVIFYFDLEANRVPSRYDEYLAMPSADIVAKLTAGEGVIAFRERKGAKPTIVIAAPRTGQLPAVEEAFSKLTSLPKQPISVTVDPKLSAEEIQSVVRASFHEAKQCYSHLLESDPKAAGTMVVKFEINGDGTVKGTTTDDGKPGSRTTLTDPAMTQCVTSMFAKLKFPAAGKTTNVGYPIAFSP